MRQPGWPFERIYIWSRGPVAVTPVGRRFDRLKRTWGLHTGIELKQHFIMPGTLDVLEPALRP